MADLPWLNHFFGETFGKDSDKTPYPYKVFYSSMHIGSTYFLPLCLISLIALVIFLLVKKEWLNSKNATRLYQFFYAFFCFGLLFSGFLSLQGAILNPTDII